MEIVHPHEYIAFVRDLKKFEECLVRTNVYRDAYLTARNTFSQPNKHFPLTKTSFWEWREGGCAFNSEDAFFNAMPPVLYAQRDNKKILFAVSPEDFVQKGIGNLVEKYLNEEFKEKVRGVGSICGFWPAFFGTDNFLDEPSKVTIPRHIIATRMLYCFKEERDIHGAVCVRPVRRFVRERLEEIANVWDTPITFIE